MFDFASAGSDVIGKTLTAELWDFVPAASVAPAVAPAAAAEDPGSMAWTVVSTVVNSVTVAVAGAAG